MTTGLKYSKTYEKTDKVLIRCPEELRLGLKDRAAEMNMSLNTYIIWCLYQHVEYEPCPGCNDTGIHPATGDWCPACRDFVLQDGVVVKGIPSIRRRGHVVYRK